MHVMPVLMGSWLPDYTKVWSWNQILKAEVASVLKAVQKKVWLVS